MRVCVCVSLCVYVCVCVCVCEREREREREESAECLSDKWCLIERLGASPIFSRIEWALVRFQTTFRFIKTQLQDFHASPRIMGGRGTGGQVDRGTVGLKIPLATV